ncbi:glycosyltransferase family 4 protein [Desulfovibrio oxamicus]|uniref:Glycosyltransferase family 4 protein n=1 Tax=Nitratidesulfovibrio oxamicus TaxID=32016 RepID=A0ABS0J0Z5_9BACT|nr:glycosyltransferase family 4 protein [Nitratidesulfovibrio oxamicus]MBG3876079.1 glycosyltransferase family 4 protein [Nitratidesulfovibrio oxamicus]
MSTKRAWGTLHPFLESGEIMGRPVANAGFMRALLRADPFPEYHFFLPGLDVAKTTETRLREEFPAIVARNGFRVSTRNDLAWMLARKPYHCFHLSDSVTDQPHVARLRNAHAPVLFPVTGVTHSLSYARYPSRFLAHLWPGTTARDAVVATSTAGQGVVLRMFEQLRRAYGLDEEAYPAPHVERIPLGVDAVVLNAASGALHPQGGRQGGAALRAGMRQRLGVDAEPVLLVFARIAHYSKMDLLPLLRALQRAEGLGLAHGGYLLVVAGFVKPGDDTPARISELAERLGIRIRVVPSPSDAERAALFAAADVFVSPVDNMQETFGLTLVEAGAAGLPAVVSDYDGYRDIVVHGETGFTVPTMAPVATPGVDMLAPVFFDSQYHLLLAQQTVVDVPALAEAVARLATNADLRARMGAAARVRVLAEFTWDSVVARWLDLWEALWRQPAPGGHAGYVTGASDADTACSGAVAGAECGGDADADALRDLREAAHPLHMSYGEVFGGYPTAQLDRTMELSWTRAGEAVYRKQEFPVLYTGVERLVPPMLLQRLLFAARRPVTAGRLLDVLTGDGMDGEAAGFLLLWALKQDLLERVRPAFGTAEAVGPVAQAGPASARQEGAVAAGAGQAPAGAIPATTMPRGGGEGV